jgi:hypothetical protein
MYFILKILRLVIRLVLLPVKLVWRLLKRNPLTGLLGPLGFLLGRRRDDDDEPDWADPDDEPVIADVDEEANAATDSSGSADEAVSSTTDAPVDMGAGPARFRRILFGAGVLSGLSALVTPFVYQVPFGYVLGNGFLVRLVLDAGLPIAVTGVCVRGLSRRRERAWYGAMGWGALVVVTYLLRGVFPNPLLSPFAGAWQVLGNLGAFLGLYEPLALLSAVGVGGVVLVTGYRARPDTWKQVPDGSLGTAESGETDIVDQTPSADPSDGPAARSATDIDSAESAGPSGTTDGTAANAEDVADTSASTGEQADADEQPDDEREETKTQEPAHSEPDPVSAHREALTAANPATRVEAIQAITDAAAGREVVDQATIDALAERLEHDDDPDVRVAACEAIGQIGADTDRTETILEGYRLDPNGDVSRAASRALRDSES